MWSIVPLRLFVRMISSGVDFVFVAMRASTSPLRTMYSCFSGEGYFESRMFMFTSPSRSFASPDVLAARIFLDERRQRRARFEQFASFRSFAAA